MTIVVGRMQDVARVHEALGRSNVCAVVGPGGVGKSTLLGELVKPLGDRALYLDVQRDDRPEMVVARLAEDLALDHVVDDATDDIEPGVTVLAMRLGAADMDMVVVDHVEDHSDAIFALLAQIATSAPGVSIVIASRIQPVSTPVQTVRLAPLPIAADSGDTEAAGLTLFRHAFVHAGGDPAALVAEHGAAQRLVDATGGLPLAITVGAARAAMIGTQNALAEFSDTTPNGAATNGDPVAAVLARSLDHLEPIALDVFEMIGEFRSDPEIDDVVRASSIDRTAVTSAVERLSRRSLVSVERNRIILLPPVRRLARRSAENRRRRASLERRHYEWAIAACRIAPPLSTARITAIEADLVWAVDVALRDDRLDDAAIIAAVLDDAFRANLRHGRRLEVLDPVLSARSAALQDGHGDTSLVDAALEVALLAAAARSDALGWSAAAPVLEQAAALVDGSSTPLRHGARVDSLRAELAFDSGDLTAARHWATVATDAFRQCGDRIGVCGPLKLLADVELESGNLTEAVRLAHEVVQLAPADRRWVRAYAMSTIAMSELERGATSTVLAVAERLHAEAVDGGDVDLAVEADWLTAMAAPLQQPGPCGHLTGERAGHSVLHIEADIARALRRLAVGDATAAIAIAADCELRANFRPMRACAIDAQLLVGDAAIQLNEVAEATRAFNRALDDAFTHGYRLRVPDALDGLARVTALSFGVAKRQDPCSAAAASIRSHLGLVARPRPWVVDSIQPTGRPPVGWVESGTLTAAGLQGVREAVAPRANPSSRTSSVALSPAERAVADLVADGLSNREISARLYVSRRTVESHIAHAFQKLNVRSRTQLAAIVLADRRH